MRKRYGLAFEDQALPETEEERQSKRSGELLRIKELTFPSAIGLPSIDTPVTEDRSRPFQTTIPSPLVIPPSDGVRPPALQSAPLLSPPLLSPPLPDPERARKTQSAYNPVTTAGLWDSGITEGPGLKARPTSMFVMNERKKKEEKKRERSKSKESRKDGRRRSVDSKDYCSGLKRKGDWYRYKLKLTLKGMFKRETT